MALMTTSVAIDRTGSMMRFGGKTAVVTGGIGFAVAERLATAGAHFVVVDIDEVAGPYAAQRCRTEVLQLTVTDYPTQFALTTASWGRGCRSASFSFRVRLPIGSTARVARVDMCGPLAGLGL